LQLEVAQHGAQDDIDLELGEGGAEAATDAAAERDPGVGVGLAAEVAVGVEAFAALVETPVFVQRHDPGDDPRPGGQPPLPHLERLHHVAAGGADHRPHPQHLVGGGEPQLVLLPLGLGLQPPQDLRVAAQPLDRPGERRRGRLVAGDQQGQQLVGGLAVVDLFPLLELGAQDQRQDVDPLVELGVGEVAVDQRVNQLPVAGAHPPPAPAG